MNWFWDHLCWFRVLLRIFLLLSVFNEAFSNRQVRSPSDGWLWPGNGNPPPKLEVGENPGKQVEEDVEILEPKSYFTFIYPTTTTTIPPWTNTTLNCTCVPYYFCNESQVISPTGSGWVCKNNVEVCCRVPNTASSATTQRPWWTTPTVQPPVTSTAIPGFFPRCGTLNPNGINARILGFKDAETQFGEYPWMAALLQWKFVAGRKQFQFVCGASLIWPSVVITAAHCVNGKKPDHFTVRLGEWDTQSTSEFYPFQDVPVQDVVIHPQYYGGALYYDVALVFLKRSAVLAPHIDTICLPRANYVNYDNTSCWATGWGKNQFGRNGSYSAILKEVELPVIPQGQCQTSLRATDLGSGFNLHESFICAGGQKGIDTCIGDGGGPLVCPSIVDPNRYVLTGVVSWGIRCGDYGIPGVYVDVKKVRTWIDNTLSGRISSYETSRVTIGTLAEQYG